MSDPCQGILGKLFGHSFRVMIIKEISSPLFNFTNSRVSDESIKNMIENNKDVIERVSYCTRCGKVVK